MIRKSLVSLTTKCLLQNKFCTFFLQKVQNYNRIFYPRSHLLSGYWTISTSDLLVKTVLSTDVCFHTFSTWKQENRCVFQKLTSWYSIRGSSLCRTLMILHLCWWRNLHLSPKTSVLKDLLKSSSELLPPGKWRFFMENSRRIWLQRADIAPHTCDNGIPRPLRFLSNIWLGQVRI